MKVLGGESIDVIATLAAGRRDFPEKIGVICLQAVSR